MGLSKIALNLAEHTTKYTKMLGKLSILETKPISRVNVSGLKYSALNQDICKFVSDRSLCPSFLDKLKTVQGSGKEKVEYITKEILNKMGYKSTIKIAEENFSNSSSYAGIIFGNGEMRISKKCYDLSNEELVSLIRHELDHVDKYAKTIKNEGLEKVVNAFGGRCEYMSQEAKDIWLKFANETNSVGFDSKKYLQAIKDYKSPELMTFKNLFQKFFGFHIYCTNPLEESAYKIQKQVAGYYNIKDLTIYDVYAERIGKIKDVLLKHSQNKDVTIPKGFKGASSFDELYCYAKVLQEKDGVQILKNKNMQKAAEVLQKETSSTENCLILDQVYSWLKNEKFNLTDILSDLS